MKTFSILSFILLISTAALAEDQVQYDIRIDGMTCPFCVASSEKALKKIDGINTIRTNIETGTMTVCAEPSVILTDDQLEQLFLKKGFTYRSLTQSNHCSLDGSEADTSIDESSNGHEHE